MFWRGHSTSVLAAGLLILILWGAGSSTPDTDVDVTSKAEPLSDADVVDSMLAEQGLGALPPTAAPATTTDPYPTIYGAACHGKEIEWGICEDQKVCDTCQRQDCEFADWSDWFQMGGCTGLCIRDRATSVVNNECGRPCHGAKMETRPGDDCLPEGCRVHTQDCRWSQWQDWSDCGASRVAQSVRVREVLQKPLGRGEPCQGPSNQTRPCGSERALDCQLTTWEEWTKCSSPCGGGWKARERAIAHRNENGGAPCENTTRETVPCNVQHCRVAEPCELSDWDQWKGCNAVEKHQQFRERRITRGARKGGGQCDYSLRETKPCFSKMLDPTVCGLSHWADWSACSATCGGQRFRMRRVENETRHYCFVNNDFPLKEVTSCGSQSCLTQENACVLTPWSAWEGCSQSCGAGITIRHRVIAQAGAGCTSSLREVRECMSAVCDVTDCQWGDWDQWSGCSCSCGGGLHRRNRVISASPRNGGRPCLPGEKYQVAPCSTQPCDHCLDGEWGEWGVWSSCSASCLPAHRVRHRSVARPPNHCGRPVSGLEDEFELCLEMPPCIPDRDCELSPWEPWSACSQECFGLRERRRRIMQFASGVGRECAGSTTDTLPCNPGPVEQIPSGCGPAPERACVIAAWSEWSECSASCGEGQRKRHRTIASPNANGGTPCDGSLEEVARCEAVSCDLGPCRDCRWGAWSDWGACSKCGGERFRHRLIEQMPDACGKKCTAGPAKEAGQCTSHCGDERYCLWTEWTDMTPCGDRCGRPSRIRSRQLSLVTTKPPLNADFVGHGECLDDSGRTYHTYDASTRSREECLAVLQSFRSVAGVEGVEHHDLDARCRIVIDSKKPRITELASVSLKEGAGGVGPVRGSGGEEGWRCWGLVAPFLFEGSRDTPCSGLQTHLAECPLVRCDDVCSPQDCIFSQWSAWTADCTQLCERQRTVLQFSRCGGRPCGGPLVETKACPTNCTRVQDCLLGDWSEWAPQVCHPPKQRTRKRPVLQQPQHGGAACTGVLEETAPCDPESETRDCEVGLWSSWTACSHTCGPGLRARSRSVVSEAQDGGSPCAGSLEDIESCITSVCPNLEQDGKFAAWSAWSACTDEGLMFRHRNVSVEPRDGGEAVQGPVLEARVCSGVVDCVVSDWTTWSRCDASCGGGQQHRHRQVTENPQHGGAICPSSLQEVQGCNHFPCEVVDCQVSDWSEWSHCTADCGVGQRNRARYLDHKAELGGTGCNLNLSVVEACVGTACEPPVDCVWGHWSDWDACSCDCDGGEHKRTREVSQMPTKGGKPCEPFTKEEVAPCNTQPCHKQDCIDGRWGSWQDWSACSSTCDGGITKRSRRVEQEANHCGEPAVGLKVQHASCNGDIPCEAAVDCQFSEWTTWSFCAAMADVCVGKRQRSRQFKQHGRGNGKYCMGAMKEEQPCTPSEASGCDQHAGINCEFGQWSQWGACSATCGTGQTVRQRAIVQPQVNGGKICDSALQYTQACTVQPCSSFCEKQDCAWTEWGPWSSCTSCGGQKVRSRHIGTSATCGGAPCEAAAAEEVDDCPRQCHSPQFCVWGDWADWDPCLQDCGNSIRKRQRELQRVDERPTDEPETGLGVPLSFTEKFEKLQQRRQEIEARRFQELAVCFAAGCLSLFGVLASVRTCSRAHCLSVQDPLASAAPSRALEAFQALGLGLRRGEARYQLMHVEAAEDTPSISVVTPEPPFNWARGHGGAHRYQAVGTVAPEGW